MNQQPLDLSGIVFPSEVRPVSGATPQACAASGRVCQAVVPAPLDESYLRFVGWGQTVANNAAYGFLWSPERLRVMQTKITELLEGLSEDGRDIVVPIETIASVLTQCIDSNTAQVGSIYSRYIQDDEAMRNDARDIVDRAINIIVGTITNETLNERQNRKLTVWNTVLGDFNKAGLRAHPIIKLRNRRPMPFAFNMRY